VDEAAAPRSSLTWQHHLQGAKHPFEIHTDQKNLEYFMSAKKLNHRQARWSLLLANYNFTLIHKPGHMMGRVDALSRRPDYDHGANDNDGVALIEPHHIGRLEVEIEDGSTQFVERIRKDKAVEDVVRELYGRIGGQEFTLMFDVMLQPATFANKPKQHAQSQGVY
jgi:hypothetical protein